MTSSVPATEKARAAAKPVVNVAPKVVDALQPITLTQAELGGEIGRRISDLAYKNYMALVLDHHFIEPFQSRPFTEGYHFSRTRSWPSR